MRNFFKLVFENSIKILQILCIILYIITMKLSENDLLISRFNCLNISQIESKLWTFCQQPISGPVHIFSNKTLFIFGFFSEIILRVKVCEFKPHMEFTLFISSLLSYLGKKKICITKNKNVLFSYTVLESVPRWLTFLGDKLSNQSWHHFQSVLKKATSFDCYCIYMTKRNSIQRKLSWWPIFFTFSNADLFVVKFYVLQSQFLLFNETIQIQIFGDFHQYR